MQWLVENGEELEVGSGLLPLLAGEGGAMGYQGLSPHFAPAELAVSLCAGPGLHLAVCGWQFLQRAFEGHLLVP